MMIITINLLISYLLHTLIFPSLRFIPSYGSDAVVGWVELEWNGMADWLRLAIGWFGLLAG